MNFDDFDTQIQSDELGEDIMEFNESMSCAPTERVLYYDVPTQVKFFDFGSVIGFINIIYCFIDKIFISS